MNDHNQQAIEEMRSQMASERQRLAEITQSHEAKVAELMIQQRADHADRDKLREDLGAWECKATELEAYRVSPSDGETDACMRPATDEKCVP